MAPYKRETLSLAAKDLDAIIRILKETKDGEECLKKAYEILTQKYRGHRVRTYLLLWKIVERDVYRLWQREGFLHCTSNESPFVLPVAPKRYIHGSGHTETLDARMVGVTASISEGTRG